MSLPTEQYHNSIKLISLEKELTLTKFKVQVSFTCGDATPPPSSPAASPQPAPPPPHGVSPSPEHLAQEEGAVPQPQRLQGFLPPAEGVQVSHEASLQVSMEMCGSAPQLSTANHLNFGYQSCCDSTDRTSTRTTIPARTASATTSRPPGETTAAATGMAATTTTAITANTGRVPRPWPSCLTKTRPGDAILADITGDNSNFH